GAAAGVGGERLGVPDRQPGRDVGDGLGEPPPAGGGAPAGPAGRGGEGGDLRPAALVRAGLAAGLGVAVRPGTGPGRTVEEGRDGQAGPPPECGAATRAGAPRPGDGGVAGGRRRGTRPRRRPVSCSRRSPCPTSAPGGRPTPCGAAAGPARSSGRGTPRRARRGWRPTCRGPRGRAGPAAPSG